MISGNDLMKLAEENKKESDWIDANNKRKKYAESDPGLRYMYV